MPKRSIADLSSPRSSRYARAALPSAVPSSCWTKKVCASRCISTNAERCWFCLRSCGDRSLARGTAIPDVSAFAAAKAVINLPRRMHVEGWRFFGMERAQAAEILPGLLQLNIFAHHANNVRLLLYAIRECPRFRQGRIPSRLRSLASGEKADNFTNRVRGAAPLRPSLPRCENCAHCFSDLPTI